MEERGNSSIKKESRGGDEVMYWTHFQTVGFAVLLSGDFHSQLMIPKKFSENIRKRLPEKVALRGPSAFSDTWEVDLSTSNNATSFVGEGWLDFVATYSLKENDILIFKYKNSSYFKVSVFDGLSNWVENESSYFVKKPDLSKVTNDGERMQEKKKSKEKMEVSPQVSLVKSDHHVDEREENMRRGEFTKRRTCVEVVEESDTEVEGNMKGKYAYDPEWRPTKRSREEGLETRTTLRNGRDHESGVPPMKRVSNREASTLPRNVKGQQGSKNECLLRRRDPTREEKERAWERACKLITEESFLTVMSRSNVYWTFRLCLPKAWTDKFMPGCNQDVLLRLSLQEKINKEWRVRYNVDKNRGTGVFVSGWNHFARDNALYEFDVCVFTLSGRKEGKICLDVKIIRAIIEEEGDGSA